MASPAPKGVPLRYRHATASRPKNSITRRVRRGFLRTK